MLNKKLLGSVSSSPKVFVEDVFSTYLYTGTGSAITINNDIDLSGKGGLTWFKTRTGTTTGDHYLIDTVRGNNKLLVTTVADAQDTDGTLLTAFNSNGFSIGTNGVVNTNTRTYASWTFREQAKFFDVVTFSGNSSTQNISHNLGSEPGMIIIKRTDSTGDWWVYHRSLGNTGYLRLNLNNASATSAGIWDSTTPTSSVFSLGNGSANLSGGTYVAYLFAHNAGGFGTAGTDNVVSCGTFTADGSGGYSVNLGYEPQYVFLKRTDATGNWFILDVMRGAGVGTATTQELKANLVAAESTNAGNLMSPNATGFGVSSTLSNLDAGTYIYMAIRRPMKVPTTGTSVFSPNIFTEIVSIPTTLTSNFATDLYFVARRNSATGFYWGDKLRGSNAATNNLLTSASTAAEVTFGSTPTSFASNTGVIINQGFNNSSGAEDILYQFRRAPGFFDEVCYTGTGSARTLNHNLTVVPELMIVKKRNASASWQVYTAATGNTLKLILEENGSTEGGSTSWNGTTPTASVFSLGTDFRVNGSGDTFVNYLFATCPGVSKVGSYTGNGGTQAIACGFTGGARFVLIKRTDSTGDWYVYDTARGIVSGNDPYLLLNSTAAEVTSTDYIDPVSSGFEISSTAPAAINANGGSFIFLAIA